MSHWFLCNSSVGRRLEMSACIGLKSPHACAQHPKQQGIICVPLLWTLFCPWLAPCSDCKAGRQELSLAGITERCISSPFRTRLVLLEFEACVKQNRVRGAQQGLHRHLLTTQPWGRSSWELWGEVRSLHQRY